MLRRIFLLMIALFISFPTLARESCEWPFRTQLDIKGKTPADYQVKIIISSDDLSPDYAWSQDGSDLRISDQDDFSGQEPTSTLSFWIESWNASAKEATIWVKTPAITSNLRLYLFYGNDYALTQASAPLTFDKPGIKFHTRYSTEDPNSLAKAWDYFDSSDDNSAQYGCTYITDFTNITNRSQLKSDGSLSKRTASRNFAAFSESYFYADVSGVWQFRYGADFGHGGGLYVNNAPLDEQWGDNLWWAENWGNGTDSNNDDQILRGSINLTQGYHKLEILGFEDGDDGGITVQFKRPTRPPAYAEGWETFKTGNITINSRSCPVEEPTIKFSNHDTCGIDLRIRNNGTKFPEMWVFESPRQVILAIRNKPVDNNKPHIESIPDTRLAITLTQGIEFLNSEGTNWRCSLIPSTPSESKVDCFYSNALANSENSTPLTLNIQATDKSTVNATFTAVLYPRQFETEASDNSISKTLNISSLDPALATNCSNPGVFTRIYDTQSYDNSGTNGLVYNKEEFKQWQTDRAIYSNLYGQTILSQINNTGNPFVLTNSEYYFSILEANINIAEDGFYEFAVDGDDAIELQINGNIISAWYRGHAKNNSANDKGSVGLAKGQHRITYLHQEKTGKDSFHAYWKEPGKNIEIIPASAFFHCQGNADIQLSMSIEMQDIAAIPGSNDKAIPGAVLRYTLKGENKSVISSSPNSVVITQKISDNLSLFVESLALGVPNTSPIAFIDSTGIESSGLSYGVLSYSKDNGANFDYIPSAANTDTDGYNEEITDFKLTLDGSMLPKDTSAGTIPNFDIIYQVKVK
jgi:hypothetical protein